VIDPTQLFIGATTAFLVSFVKPILLLVTFVPWAWLVSARIEKDARYFHLNFTAWNGIFLGAGVAALAAVILVKWFWLGWPVAIIVMWAPVLTYWSYRNRQVPEGQEFTLSGQNFQERMDARRQKRSARDVTISFKGADGERVMVPSREEPLFAVYAATEELIEPAISGRAARLDLMPTKGGYVVSQSIDGVRYKREPLASDVANAVIDFLKKVAGLEVDDRRRRQIGECEVHLGGEDTELTIATSGTSAGQQARIDFNLRQRLSKPFDGIGLLAPQIEALDSVEPSHERHGIVLIGAPPGHGLTTSMYAFISRHDAFTSNIKTLERRVELRLDGVDHIAWDPNNPDVDFATNLQSILRRDPDIVLISDINDSNTATIAAGPGMQGPLIYVPQTQATIPEQIKEWVQAVTRSGDMDLKKAVRALRLVTNQRLFRSLCPNCRQGYTPTPEQAKKLGLSPDKQHQLFRASGKVQVKNKIETCPVCAGTGYLGQVAAFEVMLVDKEVRKHLAAGDLKGAYDTARRHKMIYLQEAALAKVRSGETTLEEIVRVTSPPKPAASKPKPEPAATDA
jgi:type II secretory ATPase GspE/PulE/Tfp pilus assembly ATPase PilB-like protein